ncbi:30S ribosomal protein S17 [Candidatus Berkelbacteria bacterium]|nr:30S ribosomal protein S17 [Candidatus Berkelbacteria bacterium]
MAKKQKIGTVISFNRPTAKVRVERMIRHPLYEKAYRWSSQHLTNVPTDLAVSVGDTVRIEETRPVSKRKAWTIVEVIAQATLLETV